MQRACTTSRHARRATQPSKPPGCRSRRSQRHGPRHRPIGGLLTLRIAVRPFPTDPRPVPKIGTVLLLLAIILVGVAIVCLSVAATLRRGRATEGRKDLDPEGSEREVYKRLYGKRSTTVGDPVPVERPPEADVDGSESGLSE